MSDPIDREIRLAFWKIHILHHAALQPVYGLWMLEELAEHGHRLSPGTLYPILARMEVNGWLVSRSDADVDGPRNARRTYRITSGGRKVLDMLRGELEELYREVGARDPGYGRRRRRGLASGRRKRRRSAARRQRSLR